MLKHSPSYCFFTKKPTLLDREMINSWVLLKVRDRENAARKIVREKKKINVFVVLSEKGKKGKYLK